MKRLLAFFLAAGCTGPAPVPVRPKALLPGVAIDRDAGYVDVDATVCLREGSLELIASTEVGGTHESIVKLDARPTHIHAALLLLGAAPGNPADLLHDRPPRGSHIRISLVVDHDGERTERPIHAFLRRADAATARPRIDTFLFAGSRLIDQGTGPALYACELSGNVITLSTFGDEMLCLPGMHSRDDGALVWEVDPTHLPPLGAQVTLRLRHSP